MNKRSPLYLVVLALFLGLGACTDRMQDPVAPDAAAVSSEGVVAGLSLDTVPPRSADLAGFWEEMSDEELWEHIAEGDSSAVLGVKNPGQARGIWRATVLTLPANMTGATNAVGALQGATVTGTIDPLPALELRITDLETLSALRSRPFVDYLQPLYMPAAGESEWMGDCSYGDEFRGSAPRTSRGDIIPPGLARMDIRNAWRRNAGERAVIGITDTGVSADQANLRGNFATGASTGRWHDVVTVIGGGSHDQCGHGTRVSGLALAPQNGSSIVGAAWRANGVSVRQGNGTTTSSGINSGDAARAINVAAELRRDEGFTRRRIVSMAWGSNKSRSLVEDAVRRQHASGVLLLGASGTNLGWLTGAVFPSTMAEVISVSAVNSTGGRVSGIGYGNAVELAGYIDMLGTGGHTILTRTLGGSTAAVTAVSGIAALTWTQYPNDSNEQIRRRLQIAGGNSTRNTTTGFGIVNAHRAVGGMWRTSINAPTFVDPHTNFTVSASRAGGNGPFSFRWSNGATTTSTTYRSGADGTSVSYHVDVTDAFDGVTRRSSRTTHARDSSGCTDPSQIDCG